MVLNQDEVHIVEYTINKKTIKLLIF